MNQTTEENKLPDYIQYVEKDQEIEMILRKEAVEKGEDPADFEGWAVILNRNFQKNVKLNMDIELDLDEMKEEFEEDGHFNRFLYKVIKFWEEYPWFFLSDNLDEMLFAEGGFDDWLSKRRERLIDNESDAVTEDVTEDEISEEQTDGRLDSKAEPLLHR